MKLQYLFGAMALALPLLASVPASADVIDLTANGGGNILIKFNNYASFGNLSGNNLQVSSTNFGTFQVTSIIQNGKSLYAAPSGSGDYILGVFSGITVSSISGSPPTVTTGNSGGMFSFYQISQAQLSAHRLDPSNVLSSVFGQGTGGYAVAGCATNTQCYHGITDVGGTNYLNFSLVPGADVAGDSLSATLNTLTVPITGSAGGYGDITGGAAQPQFVTGGFTTALGTKADVHFADEFCPNGSGGQCSPTVGNWANESYDPANAIVVPEPGSLVVLGGALLSLGLFRGRKRKNKIRR